MEFQNQMSPMITATMIAMMLISILFSSSLLRRFPRLRRFWLAWFNMQCQAFHTHNTHCAPLADRLRRDRAPQLAPHAHHAFFGADRGFGRYRHDHYS